MSELHKAIRGVFDPEALATLATVTSEGAPWARYMVATMDEDFTICFATFSHSRKVAQIQADPRVHLTAGAQLTHMPQNWVQVAGIAQICDDAPTRRQRWRQAWSNYFSGPDDPDYVICLVKPHYIELYGQGGQLSQVWQPG